MLEPAIYYAEHGHPLLPRVADTIKGLQGVLRDRMADLRGRVPAGRRRAEAAPALPQPALAETWKRILREAEAQGGNREAQIEAARDAFYKGFVAEAIDDFVRKTEAMDQSGTRHKGVLTGDDMACWSASYDAPQTYDYHD